MNQLHQNQHNQEPPIGLPISPVPNHLNVDEEQWKHFLTNIRSSASNRLTFIGIVYTLTGLLSIGLECELFFDENVTYIGGFVNGLLLFISGILTLILGRQQVYVLTNLFVLMIFQMTVTIITFAFYSYFSYNACNELVNCLETTSITSCSRAEKIVFILIGDLVHLFITYCLIIVNLIIIRNARRPPTHPGVSEYVMYNPETHTAPVTYQNPYATSVNSA